VSPLHSAFRRSFLGSAGCPDRVRS
jgi:hypothetical protein